MANEIEAKKRGPKGNPGKPFISDEKFLEVFRECHGNIKAICNATNYHQRTVWERISKLDLKEERIRMKDSIVAIAEDQLERMVYEGNLTAVMFTLERLARKRYARVTREEVEETAHKIVTFVLKKADEAVEKIGKGEEHTNGDSADSPT